MTSNYQMASSAFSRIGLHQNALASEAEILAALDKLANNRGLGMYDRSVAGQLWGETQKVGGKEVYVRDFIETVLKGESLVRSSIEDLEKQIRYKTDPQERNEALQDLQSYSEDLKYLTIPFGLGVPQQSKVLAQSGYIPNANHNRSSLSGHSSVIFAKQIPEKQSGSSTDLKVAFLLTLILGFVQVISMFHKHHFFSLLGYLAVFSIFLLGYFDLHYMRFVMVYLLLSVILDLAWLFVQFNEYWSPHAQTQHSSLQWAFLKFILFFVLALAFFKLVLVAILFKYRNNVANMRKTVAFLGEKFNLNAAPISPIARIVNGGNNQYQNNNYNNPNNSYSYH